MLVVQAGFAVTVTGTLTIIGTVQLTAATSVVAANVVVQQSTGVVQGFGRVSATTTATFSGSLAPGAVLSTCVACQDSFNVATPTTGTLTIGGAVTLTGASLFVKVLTSSNDVIAFQNSLTFGGITATTIFTDILDGASGTFDCITYSSVTVTTQYLVISRTGAYPWQADCMATNCPQTTLCGGTGGGGGTVARAGSAFSCTNVVGTTGCRRSSVDGSLRCTSSSVSVDSGTGNLVDPSCTGTGTTGLSVSVCSSCCTATNPPSSGTCTPACIKGDCSAALSVCQCWSDTNSFTWTGDVCDVPVCPSSCSGVLAGTCTAGALVPTCVCNAPYSGPTCSVISCSPACQNGGTCAAGPSSTFVCDCPPGWTGTDCSTVVAAGTCPPCGANGACSGTPSWTCVCNAGWSGSACNIPVCPGFIQGVSANCNGNGVCSDGVTPTCSCSTGWSGADCSTRVCLGGECQNGGTCVVSGASLTCECSPGWGGSNCTLSTQRSSSLSQGAIIGISVGAAILGVALILLLVFLLCSRVIQKHRWDKVRNNVEMMQAQQQAAQMSPRGE